MHKQCNLSVTTCDQGPVMSSRRNRGGLGTYLVEGEMSLTQMTGVKETDVLRSPPQRSVKKQQTLLRHAGEID